MIKLVVEFRRIPFVKYEPDKQKLRDNFIHEITVRNRTGYCQVCGDVSVIDGAERGNFTEFCEKCCEMEELN